MDIENLDWNKREMQQVLLGLSRSTNAAGQLRLFDSHSRARLQSRLDTTIAWMSVLGFAAEASQIDKVVGMAISPVWRVVISYHYEPYHFQQLPLPGPSL